MRRSFTVAVVLLYVYSMIPTFGLVSAIPIFALIIAALLFANGFVYSIGSPSIGGRARRYLELLGALTVWMLFLAGVNIVLGIGAHPVTGVLLDVASMSVLASGYLICNPPARTDIKIRSYMRLSVSIGIVAGIVALSLADFGGGRAENVWKPQYILWGFLFPWAWLVFRFLTMKRASRSVTSAAVTLSVLYISLGLLFGKRIVLLEAVVVAFIAIILVLRFGWPVAARILALIAALLVGFSVLTAVVPSVDLGGLFQYTTRRVADDNLSTFDRYQEFLGMLHQYSITTPVVGAGLGATQAGPGGINLHIGWLNFAFKGGLPFVAVECWVFLVAVKLLFVSQRRSTVWIAACVVNFYLGILISSAWVASPILVGHSVMNFLVLRRADEEFALRDPSSRSRRDVVQHKDPRGGGG